MEAKMNKKDFLEIIEKFLKDNPKEKKTVVTGVSACDLGMMSIGSPNLVYDLRNGRECREDTQSRVLDFINNYKKGE